MLLNPAEYVVYKLGGVNSTARILNKNPSSITRWVQCGGIPWQSHKKILAYAKKHKIDITEKDIIYGRKLSGRKS